jgi:hypothetical protein
VTEEYAESWRERLSDVPGEVKLKIIEVADAGENEKSTHDVGEHNRRHDIVDNAQRKKRKKKRTSERHNDGNEGLIPANEGKESDMPGGNREKKGKVRRTGAAATADTADMELSTKQGASITPVPERGKSRKKRKHRKPEDEK